MEIYMIAGMVLVAALLVAYSVMPRKTETRDTLKRRLSGGSGVDTMGEIREKARLVSMQQVTKKGNPVLNKLIMPTSEEEQTQLKARLISAGYRHPQAQVFFLASKTAVAAMGGLAGLVFALSQAYAPTSMAGVALFGAGLGFMLPNLWLGQAVSSRKGKIRSGLPDILDLLVVSVESGLALDAAIKRVGDEMARVHPELSEEFRIATAESQMGIPRSEALENMARRVDLDELRNLVAVISQAERFGTSVAKALRNQADALRTKRRQQAEERAQKTAVKLMLPLVFFIFPAMGVVLAGPAAIKLMESFADK